MKRLIIVLIVMILLLIGGAVAVVRFISGPTSQSETTNTPSNNGGGIVETNTEVEVTIEKSNKANTILLVVNKLSKKYSGIEYEITYDSEGLIKGVNSGSQPIDVMDQETFEKEVYLGTCSRNVCKADAGVNAVSVVIQFIDSQGKKSQFTQDFPLE